MSYAGHPIQLTRDTRHRVGVDGLAVHGVTLAIQTAGAWIGQGGLLSRVRCYVYVVWLRRLRRRLHFAVEQYATARGMTTA